MLCCRAGDLHTAWTVSSTSSEDDQLHESDADYDTRAQIGRSHAYTATRVFYRNRQSSARQVSLSANVSSSDSELSHDRQEHIKPSRQAPTADQYVTNNKHSRDHRPNYKNNELLNFNKSVKFKSDTAAGGKSADTMESRDNYYKHDIHERRNFSRDTTKQRRGNTTNSGYNDKSKQRNETEQKHSSLKVGRRENDSTGKDQVNSNHVDNMRYSRNRRTPRKWQILPIPGPGPTYNRPAEQSSVPTDDDRRPYRRNLPPRMLAKLKQTSNTSADLDTVTVISCDPNVEVTLQTADVTEVDVTHGTVSGHENEGEICLCSYTKHKAQ